MATVEQLIHDKAARAGSIAALPPDSTVLDAAQLMNARQIGSVLVLEREKLLGIFTERDVLRRVVAAHRDPARTRLAEVMTAPVACAARHTTLDEVRAAMREKRIRHMPVVESGRVLGMVSLSDLNKAEHDVQEQTIRYLEQYMSVM
jgi:CBS domain-containing protein